MNRPAFTEGLIIACLLSLAVKFAMTPLVWLLDTRMTLVILATGTCLVYNLYLVYRSRVTIGRISVVIAWSMVTILLWIAQVPPAAFILAQLVMTWLIRSLFFYASFISALLDLGLVVTGTLAGSWAVAQTSGLAAGVWCFLLLQSLFVTIPASWGINRSTQHDSDRFEYAWLCARSALEKLSGEKQSSIT